MMNITARIFTISFLSFSLLLTAHIKQTHAQARISASKKTSSSSSSSLKGLSPHSILGIYLKTLDNQDTTPDLPIYTKATQEWKKTWTVTSTQMANEARDIRRCGKGELKSTSRHAVIRYNPANRECNPFFFQMEGGVWRLDFLTMMKTMRFNNNDHWHFSSMKHPYIFAFKDWKFDNNGFPHK